MPMSMGAMPAGKRSHQNQLHHQVHQGHCQAEPGAEASEDGSQAQPRLGVGGDAEHGRVVELVEIVVGPFPPGASLLLIGDLLALVAQLRHNPPQEGRGVVQPAKDLDELPVIEPGSGEMLDLLHIRELLDGPVIAAPEPVHDPILLAAGLDADDNLVALLPLVHVLGESAPRGPGNPPPSR